MIIRIRLFVVVVSLLIPSLLVGQTKSEDAVWKLLSSKDVETLATNYHVFADYLRSVRLIRMSTGEAGSANA